MANSTLTKESVHLFATASPSGASTVEFTNLTSDYAMYEIVMLNLDPSADNTLMFRTSTDNGTSFDSGTSDYDWSVYEVDTTAAQNDDTADSEIEIHRGSGGSSANESISGWVRVYKPSDAEYTVINWHTVGSTTGSTVLSTYGGGRRESAADVDAVQIAPSTGTITGEVRVYAYKNV